MRSKLPLKSATDEKDLSAESFGESFGSDLRQARDDASMIMILCNNCSHYSMNSQTCINADGASALTSVQVSNLDQLFF